MPGPDWPLIVVTLGAGTALLVPQRLKLWKEANNGIYKVD